jgi:ribosomal protein S4
MDQEPAAIQTIAMAEYALDLGIPIVDFLLRLRLVETEEVARQLIAASKVFINEACVDSPELVIRTKQIGSGALVKAGAQQVRVVKWIDGDSLR